MNRNPRSAVRKTLSQEVGFVCPIKGCSSPYLSWHHFDPPWHVKEHHNPSGMIALCKQHHAEADSGAWTKDQLKKLKTNSAKTPKGRFNWKRDQVLLFAGSNFYSNVEIILQIQNKPIIWFSNDEEMNQLLNFDLYEKNNKIVASMRDNTWIVRNSIITMECPPSAKKLKFSLHDGIIFDLTFSELTHNKLFQLIKKVTAKCEKAVYISMSKNKNTPQHFLPDYKNDNYIQTKAQEKYDALISNYDTSRSVVLCEVNLKLIYPYRIIFGSTKTTLPNCNQFMNCYFSDGKIAFNMD